ncbi:MAG: flagellar assembly protein FliW [Marmoricola sp.]
MTVTTTDAAAATRLAGPVVELVRPLLGFPAARRFNLAQLADDGSLYALRSVDDADLRFLLVPAGRFFPGYAPVVDDTVVEELGIRTADDVLVLVLLTAGSSLATTSANLLAPVLVNVHTSQAVQVVLDDPTLSLHAPLVS